jgi:sulfofructosephosphate aldolase
MVRAFVARARSAGLLSIIEPVSRAPRDGRPWDWNSGVLAAARELGDLGADLYKAEVPTLGAADDATVTQGAAQLSAILRCPWVVLSNGTPPRRFGDAAVAACRGGASGFLAGRAIWQASISATDIAADLEASAAVRLRDLAARIDDVARPFAAALAGNRK